MKVLTEEITIANMKAVTNVTPTVIDKIKFASSHKQTEMPITT